MAIWITSDWHFNHNRDFIWKARGFNSVNEMNNEIVKRHNSVVADDDDVYVLGDLCMSGDLEANKTLIERLKGKLHIVFGNHCTGNRQKMYLDCKNVVEICGYGTILRYKKYNFFLSHWPTNTTNMDDKDKPLKGRLLNICGHIHTTDKYFEMKQGKGSYHIEMDAHNCYPVSIDKIIKDFEIINHKCDCNGNCGKNCKCKNN